MTSLFRPKTFPGIAFGLSVDVIDLVIFLSIVTVNFVFLPCTRISDMVTFSSLTIFYGFGNKIFMMIGRFKMIARNQQNKMILKYFLLKCCQRDGKVT